MPMWGLSKTRPMLEIHPLEFTRARLDEERRGKAQRGSAQSGAPRRIVAAAGDLNDTYVKAIRGALADLRDAYLDMVEAPAAGQPHTDRLHRISLELKDLTRPMGYGDIAQAAVSLAHLCQTTDKAIAHPELIKLHIDSLRTLANHAVKKDGDGDSAELLEALTIAVDSLLGS